MARKGRGASPRVHRATGHGSLGEAETRTYQLGDFPTPLQAAHPWREFLEKKKSLRNPGWSAARPGSARRGRRLGRARNSRAQLGRLAGAEVRARRQADRALRALSAGSTARAPRRPQRNGRFRPRHKPGLGGGGGAHGWRRRRPRARPSPPPRPRPRSEGPSSGGRPDGARAARGGLNAVPFAAAHFFLPFPLSAPRSPRWGLLANKVQPQDG